MTRTHHDPVAFCRDFIPEYTTDELIWLLDVMRGRVANRDYPCADRITPDRACAILVTPLRYELSRRGVAA